MNAISPPTVLPPPLRLSDRLLQKLMEALMGDRGVHIETIYATLGALAGFGCQMGLRAGLIDQGTLTEEDIFIRAECRNGEIFFFGDRLNEPLLAPDPESVSVLTLIHAATEAAGASMFPDVGEIVIKAAETCGTESFYSLDVPDEHQPAFDLLSLLRRFWPVTRILLESENSDPLHWGWIVAQGAATLIEQTGSVLEPEMAAKIFFETAIRGSKIDPARVT